MPPKKIEKRSEVRDAGEREQNVAIEKGFTDAPEVEVEVTTLPAHKCPTCGRDKVNN